MTRHHLTDTEILALHFDTQPDGNVHEHVSSCATCQARGSAVATPPELLITPGATGGLIGLLVGAGIPEERVKHYEEGIKKGGILMGVTPRTPEDAEYFEQDWKTNRGESVYR